MFLSRFHFTPGSKEQVNQSIADGNSLYRITEEYCDCQTALGAHRPDAAELAELSNQIYAMRKLRGIKHILLSKNWCKTPNSTQQTFHIDDLELVPFLADISENCLYQIDLYQRY